MAKRDSTVVTRPKRQLIWDMWMKDGRAWVWLKWLWAFLQSPHWWPWPMRYGVWFLRLIRPCMKADTVIVYDEIIDGFGAGPIRQHIGKTFVDCMFVNHASMRFKDCGF